MVITYRQVSAACGGVYTPTNQTSVYTEVNDADYSLNSLTRLHAKKHPVWDFTEKLHPT